MNLYLVTVLTECGMYEEQVQATSGKDAIKQALHDLIEDCEIDEGSFVRASVEIIEGDV